jgi:hypothetical protein
MDHKVLPEVKALLEAREVLVLMDHKVFKGYREI